VQHFGVHEVSLEEKKAWGSLKIGFRGGKREEAQIPFSFVPECWRKKGKGGAGRSLMRYMKEKGEDASEIREIKI